MESNLNTTLAQQSKDSIDRIYSEREFHNKRFAEEVRQPTHRFYRTVSAAFNHYESEKAQCVKDKVVLEYGCGTGGNALKLAPECKSIHGLDLSDVAINQAKKIAMEKGLANATFSAGNAEEMTFESNAFDFVFGSSILHHLDLDKAYAELYRVTRPGGCALFLEPLGHNPLINAYRVKTPEFRTPDEHPLLRADFALAKKYFDRVESRFYGLATLGAIPFIETPFAGPMMIAGSVLDKFLLRLPGLKWMSWFSLITLKKKADDS